MPYGGLPPSDAGRRCGVATQLSEGKLRRFLIQA
jgi:hypothetical protein